jgi:hypothetical protein
MPALGSTRPAPPRSPGKAEQLTRPRASRASPSLVRRARPGPPPSAARNYYLVTKEGSFERLYLLSRQTVWGVLSVEGILLHPGLGVRDFACGNMCWLVGGRSAQGFRRAVRWRGSVVRVRGARGLRSLCGSSRLFKSASCLRAN